jgi:anti-sigma factor RsiW
MDCKKIRELLLTDHADGEASYRYRRIIKDHLASCGECRALERRIREVSRKPFKNVPTAVPPPEIWDKIKAELAGSPSPREESLYARLRELAAGILTVRRPVIAFAAATALLMAIVITLLPPSRTNGIGEYLEEQAEFFMYPETGGENSQYPDFGTSIEEYFL